MDTTTESFEAEASTFTEATFCERGSIGEAIGHTTVTRESDDDTIARLLTARSVTS